MPGCFDDPVFVRKTRRVLSAADQRMAAIIRQVGPFAPGVVANTFEALVQSIIHQQLSMKAARTISGRVRGLCNGRRLTPRTLAGASDEVLRSAGLSRQKVSYLRSVCEHFLSGAVRPARLRRLPDQEVIETLVAIKGVGVWTAEMILIFNLERPDVWPIDDLGLRVALQRFFEMPSKAGRSLLLQAGEPFRPYRSVATWYLWSSLSTGVVPGFR